MNAVRQIHKVQNGSVTVQLPPDFSASEVEVIVLPVEAEVTSANGAAEKSAGSTVGNAKYWKSVARILATDTSEFSEEKKKAFQRTSEILLRGRKPGEPPVFGAFEGLVWVADDFDAPMEDFEDLFYGSESDEYGMSLNQNP